MKRKSDLDFKLTKLELKTVSTVSVPHFAAVDVSGCIPHDFGAEDFAEYFIHITELEVENLENTSKFFLHRNLGKYGDAETVQELEELA